MTRSVLLVVAVAASLASSSIALRAQTAEQRAACEADVKKLCTGVMPGGGRLLKCLSEQKDKVSETCRKALKI